MTPFAKILLVALMAACVLVLLFRIARRWWRDRQALQSALRRPVPAPQAVRVVVDAPVTPAEPLPTAAARVVEPIAAPVITHEAPAAGYGFPNRNPQFSNASAMSRRFEASDLPFADTTDYSYGGATPLLAAMLPEGDQKKVAMKRTLQNAGYYTPHAWENLAATRYIGLIIPILLFGALLIIVPPALEFTIIGCLVAFSILGYSLPGLLVQSQASSRLKDIEQGMPDMIDMLNMCVSQGMTLPTALSRVGQELKGVYPALSQELAIASDQSRIAGLTHALENMADRVDTPDVHSFVSLLVQTERMGTSVSGALTDYSENMRESLRQRSDLKANAATFKLLFPTVLCLMPAVFLFLLGPAIVQLSDFYGRGGTQLLRDSIPLEEANAR
jgi:tight adherence protein C